MSRITKLVNSENHCAQLIRSVFQNSYKIEANLIGAVKFPPLARTAHDIQETNRSFYGLWIKSRLAGVVEVELSDFKLEISSLVVEPDFFRQSVASDLIKFLFQSLAPKAGCEVAYVETAERNLPAIKLYQKFGFTIIKTWIPDHGIRKVRLKAELNR